ncbi:MAG TPA: hypothetical protein VMS78_01125 [Rhizomicrobium sp.]|nr:hypothetical protein [Rhizomicrobium sp.]
MSLIILFVIIGGCFLAYFIRDHSRNISIDILRLREEIAHHHQYNMTKLEAETDRIVAGLERVSDTLDNLKRHDTTEINDLLKELREDVASISADFGGAVHSLNTIGENTSDIVSTVHAHFPLPETDGWPESHLLSSDK